MNHERAEYNTHTHLYKIMRVKVSFISSCSALCNSMMHCAVLMHINFKYWYLGYSGNKALIDNTPTECLH